MQTQTALFIGIDIGSSFIKLSLLDPPNRILKTIHYPQQQLKIISQQQSWSQQQPQLWWKYIEQGLQSIIKNLSYQQYIQGIGISYQMHGLVMVNQHLQAIYNCIIWCDGRATQIGNQLHQLFTKSGISPKLLNHPSNFTLSKLIWIKQLKPQIYNKIFKILLPGDYIAMKLTGRCQTTKQGLSQAVLWNYLQNQLCKEILQLTSIKQTFIPSIVDNFQIQAVTSQLFNSKYQLSKGINIYYRSGDQPNNAFALNVLQPGEIAVTAGTSGTIFAVSQQLTSQQSLKFNSFLHVNHTLSHPRIGKLLCINGCGSIYQWIKNLLGSYTYEQMNQISKSHNSDGLFVLPFGNGPQRMLQNIDIKCHIIGLDFKRHNYANIIRATIQGVAFSFVYGAQLIKSNNTEMCIMKAGRGNMFQCEVFCTIISTLLRVIIQIYETNGADGAAKAAYLGYLKCNSSKEAQHYKINNIKIKEYKPEDKYRQNLQKIYKKWKQTLSIFIQHTTK